MKPAPKTPPPTSGRPPAESTPTPDALALARAIEAVNALPLAPEAKAAIVARLAGIDTKP